MLEKCRSMMAVWGFVDMDNLKKINDVYGHKAGDACSQAGRSNAHRVHGERRWFCRLDEMNSCSLPGGIRKKR